MADIFNEFFENISSKINEKIRRTKKLAFDYLHSNTDSSFFISPVNTLEIVDIISSLKNGKAAGPFSIPMNLLKILSNLIAEPLCTIVNESFSTGIFPYDLKLAKVIPLHKKGSTDDPTNYRPISLLSIFSKIIEKLMHKRLYKFIEMHSSLNPLQFGFREKHSTLHTLVSLTESIKGSIDNMVVEYSLIYRRLLIL